MTQSPSDRSAQRFIYHPLEEIVGSRVPRRGNRFNRWLARFLLRSLGWRPMAHAVLLWLLVSSSTLALVMSDLLPPISTS